MTLDLQPFDPCAWSDADLTDYASVRRFLYSLRYHGAKYGLERMEALVAALGQPQRAYPVIHVAGTNGKGSVCAHLESIYRHAGLRTGLFTSPHLVHQGERIQIDRGLLSHASIVAYTRELRAVAAEVSAGDPEQHPSFFEFMTAMAFLHFERSQVDLAIVETGLGGRLDATNVVLPEVAVLTSVGLDHTDILGDTLEAIAGEKAGIFKAGRPVVLGRLPPEAERVARARAAERGCPVSHVVERFGDDLSAYPESPLEGEHQRLNAGIATLVTEVLQPHFPVAREALRAGLSNVRWAGRWDRYHLEGREVILDATHNTEGLPFLLRQLKGLTAAQGRKPIVVFGCMGLQRGRELLPALAPLARELWLVRAQQPKACHPQELLPCLPEALRASARTASIDRLFPGAQRCAVGAPGDTVVVCGSIYLIGEVLEAVRGEGAQGGLLQDPV